MAEWTQAIDTLLVRSGVAAWVDANGTVALLVGSATLLLAVVAVVAFRAVLRVLVGLVGAAVAAALVWLFVVAFGPQAGLEITSAGLVAVMGVGALVGFGAAFAASDA
jgi:hypothetical protein